jgi:hypothetical protein
MFWLDVNVFGPEFNFQEHGSDFIRPEKKKIIISIYERETMVIKMGNEYEAEIHVLGSSILECSSLIQ